MKRDNKSLLEPSLAVESYFDNLLQEVNHDSPSTQVVKLEQRSNLLSGLERELAGIDVVDEFQGEKDAATKQTLAQPGDRVTSAGVNEQESEGAVAEGPVKADNQDVEFPLQCLMFSVQQHELGLPLIEMGSVVPDRCELTRIPDSPDWVLGVLQHRGRNVKVVDTAALLSMPACKNEQESRHFLVFGEQDWALSCDHLGNVVQLNEADVQWHQSSQHGLSMGTIKQSLALLLDVEKLFRHFGELTG